jgi:hypothetical protein
LSGKVVNNALTSTSAYSKKLLAYIMPSPGVTTSSAAAWKRVLARMEDAGLSSDVAGSSAGDAAAGGETAIGAAAATGVTCGIDGHGPLA